MSEFADRLLHWFDQHGRKDLPWQRQPTPYRVWVSEIMLQQTQVATVIPYYEQFMRSFPNMQELASASEDDVLHHWSGLGYYARCRNLHKTAQFLCEQHAGEFPEQLDDVMALQGIGRSTAGAILALSRGNRHSILDGNVKRVLARFHSVEGWPGKRSVADELWGYAERHTPDERVADYTQAIMDLGATLCTRSKPRCVECPLQADCAAHALRRETDFPGRKKQQPKPRKSTVMLLAMHNNAIYLERRPPAGIWGGLWSLPEMADAAELPTWLRATLNAKAGDVQAWPSLRHSFSHYDLDIQPLAVRLSGASSKVADSEGAWYSLDQPLNVGLAAPVAKLLKKLLNSHTEGST